VTKPVIAVGQIWRSLTHLRVFRNAVKNPRAAQTKKLLQIIRANENTAYGKRYNFAKIRSIEDFQRYVPPVSYEDIRPYVERAMEGEKAQLTAESPFMFATTSGTTAKPKFVPITEAHLRDYTHAFQIHNYKAIQDHPDASEGRYLIITSNDEEGRTSADLPYGAVSGLLNKRQPQILRKYFSLPYEISKIKDVDAKYYLMLRIAVAQNITAILCCNPSSLLLLADQMKEHAAELVADVHNGTIRSRYAPPPELAYAFEKYLTPDPQRAQELEALVAKHGSLTPKTVWPNLRLMSCWKGGPMSFYLERLPESFGDIPIRDFGYMASEGRGSIPLSDKGAGGVVAITSHFFEFVKEDEVDNANPQFLTADEVRVGERYYIYFTTSAGLYRYNINDLVEVVGKEEQTPIIQFVRKGVGISSITGEKLTEEQVKVALCQAVRQLKLSEISHFTAAVQLGDPPYYACFAELNGHLPESVRNEFLRIFEQSLRAQNPEYQDKRLTRRLGPPVLEVLPAGTYTRLRQQRVLEGAPEAQVKIPLLSMLGEFEGKLSSLPELASVARGGL
jgi:hypothetical protein